MNTTVPNPDDSWAQVELFRWQYGELPKDGNDRRKLDVSEGLRNMAKAIEAGCKGGGREAMPTPFNVCSVLNYAAKLIEFTPNTTP